MKGRSGWSDFGEGNFHLAARWRPVGVRFNALHSLLIRGRGSLAFVQLLQFGLA